MSRISSSIRANSCTVYIKCVPQGFLTARGSLNQRNGPVCSERKGVPRVQNKTTQSDTWRKRHLCSFLVRPVQLVVERPVPVLLWRQSLLQLPETTGTEDETEVSDRTLVACVVK